MKKHIIDELADHLSLTYKKDKDWIKKNLFEVDQYFLDFLNNIIRR